MANTDNNTIMLQVKGNEVRTEKYVATAIMPGMLLKLSSTDRYNPHNIADGAAQKIFGTENIYMGGTIDDEYAIDSRVFAWHPRSGDIVLAWLAAGVSCSVGNFLSSNGDGTLNLIAAPVPGSIVGIALENITGGGSNARIRVEIN